MASNHRNESWGEMQRREECLNISIQLETLM